LREINNERLRKQNQYKQKKLLRAKLLESKRNIDLEKQFDIDENETFETDDEEDQEENHFESKESIECETQTCQVEQSEEQQEENDTYSEIQLHESKIPTQIVNKQTTNGTFRSAIYNSFNSIRSKFRNMINVSNEQTKTSSHPVNKSDIPKIYKPIVNKNLTKILERSASIKTSQTNLASHVTTSQSCKQRSNSSFMHDPFAKVRRVDEQMKRSVSATNVKRCLRKQESTTSCRSMKINDHHGSFGNLSNNRPAFKITKIKYDDRHLFSTVNPH
jgi:hypothetical protein